MAQFDFIDSASKAYNFVWAERVLISQLALLPFAVKLVSFVGVSVFDFQDNYFRQGLLLLPSYIFEGMLVMQLIRFAILGERGQAQLTGNLDQDARLMQSRRRGLLAGTIIYVLTKLVLSFFSALVFMGGEARKTVTPMEIGDLEAFFIGTGFLMFMIWAFRFVWLYVPAALDYSIRDFLWRIRPFLSSLSMIGVWLLSFVPVMLMLIVINKALVTTFPGAEPGTPSEIYKYALAVVQSVLDLAISIVSSLGMAYGVQSIFKNTNKPTPIF